MRKFFQGVLFLVAIMVLLGGCALQQAQKAPSTALAPVDLNAKIRAGQLVQKVDNFLVIFDASSSMAEQYDGESKLARGLRIAQGLNQTIPDVALTGGLRMAG